MLKSNIYLLLLVPIVVFVYNGVLNFQSRYANDFPLASQASIVDGFDLPRAWSPDSSALGEYVISTLWSWPLDFIFGLGGKIGIPFPVLVRLFEIIPTLGVGIWGMSKLLKNLNVGVLGMFSGTMFFLLNTYMLLVVDGGQLSIALSYVWFPVSYVLLTRAIGGIWKDKILAGLSVSAMGFFDPRFIYVLAILLLIRLVIFGLFIERGKVLKWIFGWGLTGILAIFTYVGLNFYWILPSILVKVPILPQGYSQVAQTSFLGFTTWKHALLLLQPQWYKNVFGVIPPINYAFAGIPLMVFLVPVMVFLSKFKGKMFSFLVNVKYEKEVIFWTVVAVIGIFLTKGSNPPFGFVYNFLFSNVPGFSLFRDSTKFFFLVALSYSVLIGFSVDWLTKIINKKLSNSWKLNIVPTAFAVYCLFLISPVFTGKMTGMFSKPVYEKESAVVSNMIEKDQNFSRIFFIPSRAPLGYSSPVRPSVEALRLVSLRPFAIGVVGNYEKFNYLREAPFMGELFSVAGIKYIYYPYPDTRRETLKQDNIDYYFAFTDQLANLSWVEGKISDPPVTVLKTKKTKDHIFLSDNSFYVVGSDRIYWDLVGIERFDLSKNALIFAEENPMMINDIDPKSMVLLYGKNDTDLLMSFVKKNDFYFPATNLEREPSENIGKEIEGLAGHYLGEGWWKRETADLVWWRDFLQSKYGVDNLDFDYGGGWAIAEGETIYQLPFSELEKDENLIVRVMKSNHGGKIEFWQGKEKIGEVITQSRNLETVEIKLTGYGQNTDQIFNYSKADFNWYKVGKLESEDPITIKTYGDINVVNAIAHITDSEYTDIGKKVVSLKNQGRVVDWNKLTEIQKKDLVSGEQTLTDMSFSQIDPTKYEITINKLDKPAYLIFSETFDELWQLNGQSSKRIYSLLNGFYVDKPGVYTLYFTPQKYILPGLLVSGISLLSVLGILLALRKKKK